MNGLRTLHAMLAAIGGLAFALIVCGAPSRAVTAVIAIAFIPLAWGLEKLRVAILSRPENRS